MDHPRIKIKYRPDEPPPPNLFTDHDWVRHNQADLLELYGEGYIVVYQKRVIGVGYDYVEALADAAKNLPPGDEVITPTIEPLFKRTPFLRFYAREDRT